MINFIFFISQRCDIKQCSYKYLCSHLYKVCCLNENYEAEVLIMTHIQIFNKRNLNNKQKII